MKKILPILIILIIAGGIWYYLDSQGSLQPQPGQGVDTTKGTPSDGSVDPFSGEKIPKPFSDDDDDEDMDDDDDYVEYDDRPAAEIYKTAEEAVKAIQEGAQDYDDIVLEQFTEPGEDCTWCDEFYGTITSKMLSPDASEDERSYYAEVLAISGKVDHIKTLIQGIEDSGDSDDADIYAEALELTIGGDDVVKHLATYLESSNELLQESVVAAITNQESKLAAETLYKHTIEAGDEDGYYSLGIGLGEMIPDQEALPYLNELVAKRDQYSHLAVKALLNNGLDGIKLVIGAITNSKDTEFDKKMLEDAVDHVIYDEETKNYFEKLQKTSKQPLLVDFTKEILEEFALEEDEDL